MDGCIPDFLLVLISPSLAALKAVRTQRGIAHNKEIIKPAADPRSCLHTGFVITERTEALVD